MADVVGDPPLNLKQVARLLDVHYMTAYRYVRSGRLPARRDGAAWLVDRGDLDAFRAATRTVGRARVLGADPPGAERAEPRPPSEDGDASASGDGRSAAEARSPGGSARRRASAGPAGPVGPARTVDRVARVRSRLVVGDEAGAWAEVEAALVAGWSPEEVIVDLVSEAVRRTGPVDGLAAGHLAVTAAARTIAGVSARFRRPGRSRGTVVLGAPAGEGHTLGLTVIADVLRMRNLHVLDLGSRVPAAAFAEAATMAGRLVAVGVGVTTVDHLDDARAVTEAVRAVDPAIPVLVGGRAVANPEIAGLTGATAWAADARGMVELVEARLPPRRKPRPQSTAPPPPPLLA